MERRECRKGAYRGGIGFGYGNCGCGGGFVDGSRPPVNRAEVAEVAVPKWRWLWEQRCSGGGTDRIDGERHGSLPASGRKVGMSCQDSLV